MAAWSGAGFLPWMRRAFQLLTTPVGGSDLHRSGHWVDLICDFTNNLVSSIEVRRKVVHHNKLSFGGFRFITKASWNQFWVPPPKFEHEVNFAQWRYSNQWSNREVLLLLVENYTQYPALTGWNTLVWGNFWRLLRKQITPDSIFLNFNMKDYSPTPFNISHSMCETTNLTDTSDDLVVNIPGLESVRGVQS